MPLPLDFDSTPNPLPLPVPLGLIAARGHAPRYQPVTVRLQVTVQLLGLHLGSIFDYLNIEGYRLHLVLYLII